MKKINIGMLGIGNVGQGTYMTLEQGRTKIEAATGLDLHITKILCRHPEVDRGLSIPMDVYTTDAYDIINDPDIDIVVEVIGGIEAATEYMAAALKKGKHVVTANKAALAANGKMLQQLAQDNHVMLRFEASVAGGIPILSSITSPLLPNKFTQVQGILNGTTNYILTQMSEFGKDYAEVLKDAQDKGFAEADPTGDVEGIDAANKLAILISLLFGVGIDPMEIPRQGITKVDSTDMQYADEKGYAIKLLASAVQEGDTYTCNVEPALVTKAHPLASVGNEFNAVYVTGNAVDSLMFYGRGAGPLPTGSAVMGDVLYIAGQMSKEAAYDEKPLLRYDEDLAFSGAGKAPYYLRVMAANKPGVLGNIVATLGDYAISVKSMVQQGSSCEEDGAVPFIFVVDKTTRVELEQAMNKLVEENYIEGVCNMLRVEE